MGTESAERLTAIQAQIQNNPAILAALRANDKKLGGSGQYTHRGDPRFRVPAKDVLKQFGIDFPDAEDYRISQDPQSGAITMQRANWLQRNADWVLPVATIGTAGVASAFAPAAAAVPSTGGVGVGETSAVTGLAGSGLGTAASTAGTGVAATAAQPSLWSKVFTNPVVAAGIPAAATVIGTKIQANANKSAAQIEADSTREALEWEKQQYAIRQGQLRPYINTGTAAQTRIADLMGLATPQGGWSADQSPAPPGSAQIAPPATPQAPPTAAPASQAPAVPSGVSMKAPDGRILNVPPDKVANLEARGAVRI